MTGEQEKQGRGRSDVAANPAPGAKTSNPYAIDVVRLRKKELSRGITNTEQLLESLVEHGVLSYDKRMALSTLRTREERNTRMLEMVARSGERACRLFFHPCLKQAEPELYSAIRRYVGEVSRQVGDSRRQLIGYLLERDNGSLEEFENCDDPPGKVKVIARKPKKLPVVDAPPPKVEKPADEPPPPQQPEVPVVTDEAIFKAATDGDLAYFERASVTSGDVNKANDRKETLLHVAAARGHTRLAEFLLKKGAEFTATDVSGRTALHAAAENGHDEVVRLLLGAGADVYAPDKKGENAAELALRNDRASTAGVLVEHEKTRRDRRRHLVHVAALKNDSRAVAALLRCGAGVDAADEKDRTALHYAVAGGFRETAEVLLSAGAKFDRELVDAAFDANDPGVFELLLSHASGGMSDEAKVKLLFKATERGLDGTVLALLKRGADPDAADAARSSYTPLLLAAEMGHADVARVLLEHGARVDARTSDSDSALHLASAGGHVSTARLLLAKGLAVGVAGRLERTALHSAAAAGHLAAAELLLREGAKACAGSRDGATPLHVAVEFGRVEVARLLLKNGANPAAPDKKGRTPLHLAATGGDAPLLEALLEDKRADVNAADAEKKTPLHLAAGRGHAASVALLLSRGAKAFARDMDGNAALHFAAAAAGGGGGAEAAGALLEAGRAGKTNSKRKAAADERNAWRKTPLHVAAETGRPEMVELLLRSGGASVNALDNARDTPLHCAARAGHVAVVRVLVAWADGTEKPNLFAANALDKTPLQLAEAGDSDAHREIATLLRKKMRII